MGFLKKLFGFEEGSVGQGRPETPLHLTLNDVDERVNELLNKKKGGAFTSSKPKVTEIIEKKAAAREVVEHLGELEFDEDTKERTYKPIITSKPVYIRGMREALKGITDSKPETFEELEEFCLDLSKSLKTIHTVQSKQGRYMIAVFRDEMLKLGTILNRIMDITNELGGDIGEVRNDIEETKEIIKNVGFLKERHSTIKEERDRRGKRLKNVKTLEEEKVQILKKLQDLEDSTEFKKYLNLKDNIQKIVSEQKKIEKGIFNSIGPLRRPLRKYEKLIGSKNLETENGFLEKLREYQSSAKAAFESEEPGNVLLTQILLGLKKAITNGQVNLDGREEKKALTRIEELSGQIKKTHTRLAALKLKEKSLLKQISKLDVIERKEELISRNRECEEKREEALAEASEEPHHGEAIETYKSEVEKRVSEIEGRPVVLELPELEDDSINRQDL